jgi:hypothetical protein
MFSRVSSVLVGFVFLFAVGCSDDDGGGGPPAGGAQAFRITDASDLLDGVLAHGRVGDYMLANSVARFVIQDVGKRDMYSIGAFGGNIIDAELVSRPGTDNFLEIQPAVNVETVINAQTVDILNDGSNGEAAVIRTCGPDDVLDFVNPSTIIEDIGGLTFPPSADDVDYDVEGCTEYSLEVDKPYVRMETTIFNNEDRDLPLFVGDYLNAAGEVGQWTSSGAGVGEVLTADLGVMSFVGFGSATGVDYSHVAISIPESDSGSSFFTASGVSQVMHSQSILGAIAGLPSVFVVPAMGSNSFVRYFGVGDGSGANAVDIENEVKGLPIGVLRGCVTVAGDPAPAARVAVGPLDDDGAIAGLTTLFVTGEDGCYSGTLVPGEYGVAGAREGTPYEGSGEAPLVHSVSVGEGETVEQDIALPATGRLRVQVVGESGPIPARVSVVGFDPSPEPIFGGNDPTGLFNDNNSEPSTRFGLADFSYTNAAGEAEFNLEPGDYEVFVSRGTEYSAFQQRVTIEPGVVFEIPAARIARVIDSSGFVSSDFHIHGINSADSRVSHLDRVQQYAGEGVDNIVMTDHHVHTDLNPVIDELEFTPFLKATIGEEVTTWDYGHFNAYPMTVDPDRPSRGSTDWGRAAEPGKDFKSLGAFSLTPHELDELATTGPNSTVDTVVQINHIDSHFDPLRIDTARVPPRSMISAADKLRYRLDPDSGDLFHHFPALEVWNDDDRGGQAQFLDLRIGIWFNHLNQGLQTTAIADTDSHSFFDLRSAGARSWTASSTDAPASIDPGEVARSVAAGRVIGGQGPFVNARLLADDGSMGVADLTLEGSTLVESATGDVELEIFVQSPVWAAYDRIEIYANAQTVVSATRDDIPTLYTAEPTMVLTAGEDFGIDRVVVSATPGAERFETRLTLPFAGLSQDTWFVVLVRGTDGVSPPMFPIFADNLARASNQTLDDLLDGNLGEAGVMALGFTNALYADVDGEPGFDAPLAP